MKFHLLLTEKKPKILRRWFDLVVNTYPSDVSDFLRSEKDPFANPVGHTLSSGLERLLDHLLHEGRPDPDPRIGEDVVKGETVLEAGRLVRPQEIGLLASLGRDKVAVHRRPRVAILSTGDELLDITEPLVPGRIRSSNEYTTAALVQRTGGIPVRLGIARDTVGDLTSKIQFGLSEGADLFLTSGGVSVGDYDVVKDVLGREGLMQFWQVKMKPGKPLAFGLLPGGVPLIGLPGNPVSAMVSFEQFARPAILKMLGRIDLLKPTVRAVLDDPLTNSGRRGFVRVIVERRAGRYHARSTGEQGSGVLTSMTKANGLAIVPEEVFDLPAGSIVEVQMLDWPEGTGVQ